MYPTSVPSVRLSVANEYPNHRYKSLVSQVLSSRLTNKFTGSLEFHPLRSPVTTGHRPPSARPSARPTSDTSDAPGLVTVRAPRPRSPRPPRRLHSYTRAWHSTGRRAPRPGDDAHGRDWPSTLTGDLAGRTGAIFTSYIGCSRRLPARSFPVPLAGRVPARAGA